MGVLLTRTSADLYDRSVAIRDQRAIQVPVKFQVRT